MSVTYIPVAVRRAVIARARNRCEYCLCPATYSAFTLQVDHILPESKGGISTEDNLAYSCGCNGFKNQAAEGQDTQTNTTVPLFHPRLNRWQDHFQWSEDGLEIIGTTPTGRVTVVALNMNRPGLVGLRRLLIVSGEHPPPE